MSNRLKINDIRGKKREELIKLLEDQKTELASLRVSFEHGSYIKCH